LDADHGFHFDNTGSDLDQAQAQGIELDSAPDLAFRHGYAQTPQKPIGTNMEE